MRLLEFNVSFNMTLDSTDYKFNLIPLVSGEIKQAITTFESSNFC